jgi:hypothetical protein
MNGVVNEQRNHDRTKAILRISFALIMVLIGALTVALTRGQGASSALLEQIGLAFIVGGIVGLFTEFAFGPYWLHPPKSQKCPFAPSTESGMQMIKHERIGYDGYHAWLLGLEPQEMFFAGRSVLHRMKKDFEDRRLPPFDEALIEKVKGGSTIRILFIDPQWNLIERIAAQEGRNSSTELYADLKITFSIVYQIWNKLQNISYSLPGSIDIRVYKEISQYAYHYVENSKENKVDMYVGFYFAQQLGWQSALFQVHSVEVQKVFNRHFSVIFDRAHQILSYPKGGGGLQKFDNSFYELAMNHLDSRLTVPARNTNGPDSE